MPHSPSWAHDLSSQLSALSSNALGATGSTAATIPSPIAAGRISPRLSVDPAVRGQRHGCGFGCRSGLFRLAAPERRRCVRLDPFDRPGARPDRQNVAAWYGTSVRRICSTIGSLLIAALSPDGTTV